MIFLDMDGVLVNFHKAALALYGMEPTSDDPRTSETIGITSEQLWERIAEVGEDFYANLELLPWATWLIDLCSNLGEICIATSPGPLPCAASGKMKSLKKLFGPDFKNFHIGKQKYLLASPGRILIDDFDSNVEEFEAYGGKSILIPQSWNRNKGKDVKDVVTSQLNKFFN